MSLWLSTPWGEAMRAGTVHGDYSITRDYSSTRYMNVPFPHWENQGMRGAWDPRGPRRGRGRRRGAVPADPGLPPRWELFRGSGCAPPPRVPTDSEST